MIEVTHVFDNVTDAGYSHGGDGATTFSDWIDLGGRGGAGMVKVMIAGANENECSWFMWVKTNADDADPTKVFSFTSPPTENGGSLTVDTSSGMNYDSHIFEWTGKLWTHAMVVLFRNVVTGTSSTDSFGSTRTHGTSAWIIAGDPSTI